MNQFVALSNSAQGNQGLISHIDGDQALKRKLMSLGLRKGQMVSILQQRSNGVVVMSNGSRVAIGASIAEHVFLQMQQSSDNEIQ